MFSRSSSVWSSCDVDIFSASHYLLVLIMDEGSEPDSVTHGLQPTIQQGSCLIVIIPDGFRHCVQYCANSYTLVPVEHDSTSEILELS